VVSDVIVKARIYEPEIAIGVFRLGKMNVNALRSIDLVLFALASYLEIYLRSSRTLYHLEARRQHITLWEVPELAQPMINIRLLEGSREILGHLSVFFDRVD
jgi:hypothetical protein